MFNKFTQKLENNGTYNKLKNKAYSAADTYTKNAMEAADRVMQKVTDASLTAADELSNKAADALNNQVNNINATLDKLNVNQMGFNDRNIAEIKGEDGVNNNQTILNNNQPTTGGKKKKKNKKGGCCGCGRRGGRARSRSKRRTKSKSKSRKYK